MNSDDAAGALMTAGFSITRHKPGEVEGSNSKKAMVVAMKYGNGKWSGSVDRNGKRVANFSVDSLVAFKVAMAREAEAA